MKRMLFASHHCYLDQSNGASITTRQILLELSTRGWEVDAFCGAGFDYESSSAVDAALAQCDVVLRNRVALLNKSRRKVDEKWIFSERLFRKERIYVQ